MSGGGATGEVSGAELEDQLKLWESVPLGEDADVVQAIAQGLIARRDDEEFYFRVVPRLPPGLVTQLIESRPRDFDIILRAYNEHIQGGLPFKYCDVVANFYRLIFRATEDLSLKKLILTRLIEIGAGHSRWHVGSVVAELLSGLGEEPEREMAADVVRSDPYHARWFESYVANRELPSEVRSAFDSLSPQDDDIPF